MHLLFSFCCRCVLSLLEANKSELQSNEDQGVIFLLIQTLRLLPPPVVKVIFLSLITMEQNPATGSTCWTLEEAVLINKSAAVGADVLKTDPRTLFTWDNA